MNKMFDDKLPSFFSELMNPEKPQQAPLAAVNRRQFFKISGVAGGGLVLGLANNASKAQQAEGEEATAILTPYVQIQPNGRINIFSKNPECGQGIKTGLPLIIAEELDARWEDVDVLQADIDSIYGVQFAGGSQSTPQNWMAMRQAGAAARAMILAAAAETLYVPVSVLSTRESKVVHTESGREFGYGEFAELAASMPVPEPEQLELKNPADFSILGRRYSGVDNEAIVRGQPLFGIDQQLDGMLYATFTKAPAINGSVRSFNRDHILSLNGVVDAFALSPSGYAVPFGPASGSHFGGVAIVASSTWAAMKAKQELEVVWDNSSADLAASSSRSAERAYSLAAQQGSRVIRDSGNVDEALENAETLVEAFYEYPYVSHVNLEPQNCTALYENGRVEIWAPSQTPQSGEQGVAAMTGLEPANVVLHQTRIGGGFGRRLNNDFVNEVVAIARRMEGIPIKLQWTREDDMAFDYYRPGGFHSYRAGLDAQGRLIAFQDHFINFSEDGENPVGMGAMAATEFPMPYVQNARATETLEKATIPTGPMRAPRSNAFGFSFQSFLHECAVAGGRDYRDFLLEILAMTPPNDDAIMDAQRAINVIRSVTERAEWGRPMPEGRGLGLAFYYSHSGYVAQVADVSVSDDKAVTVHKVWSVQDFGFIHNLSAAEHQIQGSVLDGLSQLMYAKISFENGVIQQSNFHQYPMLRMRNAPEVEVYFLQPQDVSPTGAGEPGLPPALPAIANAIYSASGERVRKTPLIELGFSLA